MRLLSGRKLDRSYGKDQLDHARRKAWKRFLRQKRQTSSQDYRLSPDTVDILSETHEPKKVQTNIEDDPYYSEYETMSGLSDWHNDDLPEDLPEVIPESFLWTVFDQLVDAFSVLGSGRVEERDDGDGVEKRAWNEIVHRDVHLMNIFVKPIDENAAGALVESHAEFRFERFKAENASSLPPPESTIILTGISQNVEKLYSPPELMKARKTGTNHVEPCHEPAGKGGHLNQPFFHFVDENNVFREQHLVNGEPYDIIPHKAHLFSGRTPFEASNFYSDTLKDVIFQCLDYRQHKRWSFAKLKSVTRSDPDTRDWPTLEALRYDDHGARNDFLRTFGRFSTEAETGESRWIGVKVVGAGSFACAGLWVEIDPNRNILRRQVIKDAKPTPQNWRDPIQWRDHLPRETDREGLIQHYGHRLMMRQRRYRIYLKYYPGGDVLTALQYNTRIHTDMLRPDHIPERFLWHVFECLVKACRVLRTGADRAIPEGDEDEHLFKDWKPITHLDISARNLFMKELGNSENPRPQIVLSDFGQAFTDLNTRSGDDPITSDNPHEYLMRAGATQWAPLQEHQRLIGNPPTQLGEKTDVWSIGALLWYLMAGNPTYEGAAKGPHREDHDPPVPVSLNDAGFMTGEVIFPRGTQYRQAEGYSRHLKTLVQWCLQWDLEERPSLDDIEESILDFAEDHPEVWGDMTPPPFVQSVDEFRKGAVLSRMPGVGWSTE
ncbi:hypothetical protein N0V83_001311 [Neocucurbitaria cava]|uniref:non-specific serine/threonine protein kinase n=1 Tax=Neocucurbitaria cava TaxID=798079 RepID=A0A9W8YEM9_9PLEO|nr:hypothetical protein N0V83_001311 [Neocucurbitaria cava]